MNNNYPFFRYITGDSKIHKMNSKYKILLILLAILIIILLKDGISILLFSIFTFFIVTNTKITSKAYINNSLCIWPLYFIVFMLAFFITFDIKVALLTMYKTYMLIIILLVLTFTTSLSEIAWGIECLFDKLKTIKVPVTKIALRIALSIKFISTVFEQNKQIRKSMAYRGIPYNKKYYKTMKNIFIPSITLSYRLSKRMITAMKLRFYGYSNKRTNYHGNKVTKRDKFIIMIEFVIIYISLWQGWFK